IVLGHPYHDHLTQIRSPPGQPAHQRMVSANQPLIAVRIKGANINITAFVQSADSNSQPFCLPAAFQFFDRIKHQSIRRFANLAFLERFSPVPRTGIDSKMILERPREFGQARKPRIQRYIGYSSGWCRFHQLGSSLQARPPDKAVQSFTRDAVENAMKMKGREVTYSRQFAQRKIAVEMLRDVVNNAVDPLFIISFIHHNPDSFVILNYPCTDGSPCPPR